MSSRKFKELKLVSPADPVDDPLKWLDEGLPDLSGFANQHFDLAMQFDIAQIQADSVSDSELERRTDTHCKPQDRSLKNVQASALAPEDSEWATWMMVEFKSVYSSVKKTLIHRKLANFLYFARLISTSATLRQICPANQPCWLFPATLLFTKFVVFFYL